MSKIQVTLTFERDFRLYNMKKGDKLVNAIGVFEPKYISPYNSIWSFSPFNASGSVELINPCLYGDYELVRSGQ